MTLIYRIPAYTLHASRILPPGFYLSDVVNGRQDPLTRFSAR